LHGAVGKPCRERVDERAHTVTVRDEEAVACAGHAARLGRPPEAYDDAPVRRLERTEARHGRDDREPLRIARVDARREWVRDALEGFAAEARPDERREALVPVLPTPRQHEVEGHAELPGPAEERRAGEWAERRRGEKQEAIGKRVEAVATGDVRPPVALARA